MSLTFLLNFRGFSRTVFLIDWIGILFFMSALRAALRLYSDYYRRDTIPDKKRILIFGAGDAGALAYRAIMVDKESAFEVVGFLDDDPAKQHKTLYGKKILGNRYGLQMLAQLYHVDDICLAVPSAPCDEMSKIIQICQQAGVTYWLFPTLRDRQLRVTATPHRDRPTRLREVPDSSGT
jgi:FlaA1/EpsC-like NDP-sugar epimerase